MFDLIMQYHLQNVKRKEAYDHYGGNIAKNEPIIIMGVIALQEEVLRINTVK